MSIRFRLNALMVTLLSLALVGVIAALVMSAGPRIRAESESMMRLSQQFVETAIESLQGAANPEAQLAVLLAGLQNLRHVRIYQTKGPLPRGPGGEPAAAEAPEAETMGPAWLARLAQPTPTLAIPVKVNDQDFGELVIAPRADDESAEIWDSIVKFSMTGAALAVATVLLMSLMIGRLLRPIKTVGDALMQLDQGKYDVAVPETGPPEIADICGKLNRLAGTLATTTSENRRLARRIIRVQDEERKDLARELHDELGPYLFAIRASVSTIKTELARGVPDRAKLLATSETMLERIETMQQMNRRVLQKLRPVGLDEFGLEAKLASLVAMWRETHPETAVALKVSDALPERDETSNLTIFRIVQEALTNAFRHADASAIDIVVEPADRENGAAKSSQRPSIHVAVSDNGKGRADEVRPSHGIAGMSERVWATGGEMQISTRPGGGIVVEAWVPAAMTATERRDGRAALP